MIIEPNVHLERCTTQIMLAMIIFGGVVEEETSAEATITSAGDGVHSSVYSKHYPNGKGEVNAFDGRIKDFDGNPLDISTIDRSLAIRVTEKLRKKLGPQYDVILEKNHIHVEFDPPKTLQFKDGKYV